MSVKDKLSFVQAGFTVLLETLHTYHMTISTRKDQYRITGIRYHFKNKRCKDTIKLKNEKDPLPNIHAG